MQISPSGLWMLAGSEARSVMSGVEHSTHPKNSMSISTFWVPLDPLHCLFPLQYETVACAYLLCFHV
jgi:hypothetical protein